jgi:hypothetical protein
LKSRPSSGAGNWLLDDINNTETAWPIYIHMSQESLFTQLSKFFFSQIRKRYTTEQVKISSLICSDKLI